VGANVERSWLATISVTYGSVACAYIALQRSTAAEAAVDYGIVLSVVRCFSGLMCRMAGSGACALYQELGKLVRIV
jgi:hypothetical protein